MNFELKIYTRKQDTIRPAPQPQDVVQAVAQLRNGDAELLDLYRADADGVLQVVSFGDVIGVAVFPSDGAPVLYSEKESLDDAEIVAMCLQYLQAGGTAGAPIRFSEVDWADRVGTLPVSPPSAESGAISEPEDDADNSPQAILASWMDEGGNNDKEWLDEALAGGATFAAFSPLPPLVYLAQHRGHPDSVAALLAHGVDVAATDDGKTALWHAVSCSNYRFADALLAAGAAEHTASTSTRYGRWKQLRAKRAKWEDQAANESHQALVSAISCGDIDRMRALLQEVPPHRVTLGLLEIAIGDSQLEALRFLLDYKGAVAPKTVDHCSLWGRALGHHDPAYIAALIEFGAYDSVSKLKAYGGTEFLHASPEALRYLLDNQLTAGLEPAFRLLVRRRKNRELLAVFPDSYFTDLTPEELINVVGAMMKWAPERIDTILVQNDYAALLRHVFKRKYDHMTSVGDLWKFVPMLFGTTIVGPEPQWNFQEEEFLAEIREGLCVIASGLL